MACTRCRAVQTPDCTTTRQRADREPRNTDAGVLVQRQHPPGRKRTRMSDWTQLIGPYKTPGGSRARPGEGQGAQRGVGQGRGRLTRPPGARRSWRSPAAELPRLEGVLGAGERAGLRRPRGRPWRRRTAMVRRSAYCLTNLAILPPRSPAMSCQTSTCPVVALPAPIPIVGRAAPGPPAAAVGRDHLHQHGEGAGRLPAPAASSISRPASSPRPCTR